MITKVAFVALPAGNPKTAGRFYIDILGLKPSEWDVDAWVEVEAACGTTIALANDPMAPYVALETDDIEKELARLRQRGVEIVKDVEPLGDGDLPFCREAIIKDSEGNVVKLHQRLAPEPGQE